MGSCPSNHTIDTTDYIHRLKQSQLMDRLIFGYLRSIENKHKIIIPDAIKSMLKQFAKAMIIQPNTDQESWIYHQRQILCLLGEGSVGKSAITFRLVQGIFVKDFDPTIEDAYRHIFHTGDDEPVELDILDTAGQECFIALRTTWMRKKDGFILVFSIVDRRSFECLQSYYDQICEVYEDDLPPFIIVGNKIDLDTTDSNLREVDVDEAKQLVKKWNALQYIEVSAKTGENIQEMFDILVSEILIQHQELESKMALPPVRTKNEF